MEPLTNQQILESIKVRLIDDKKNGARAYVATSSIEPDSIFSIYESVDVDNTQRIIELFFNYLRNKR